MRFCKFRKLSLIIIVSLTTLTGVQMVNAASYKFSSIAYPKTCRTIIELSPFLKRNNILLFGELHGTQEIPAFIADVVCMAVKKRVPVTLGLEIPFTEQEAINNFLNSRGGPASETKLTEGSFWHRKFQDGRNFTDGRSSMAILQLIEQIRALRASGAKLRIVAYDGEPGMLAQERDRVMAQNLTAAANREPKNLFVVLSGDIHNRLMRGNQWNKDYESMGYLLTKSIESSRIISFNVSHLGGEAWACLEMPPDSKITCKAFSSKSRTGDKAWTVKLTTESASPYSGTFGVGRITASPPVYP